MSKGNCRANGISERESNNQPDCKDDQDISHTSTEFLVSVGRQVAYQVAVAQASSARGPRGWNGQVRSIRETPVRTQRSSLSASARSSFSRRKCSSRDSGDRHIPAQRWCCRAIARYSIEVTMMSSHASAVPPAKPERTAWDAQTGPIKVRLENSNALRWRSIDLSLHNNPKFKD
jgi:hypothetical protein